MRDRRSERSGFGPFGVYMDPLMIAGSVGERIDLVLCHLVVVRPPEVLPDFAFEIFNSVNYGWHG